MSAVVAEMAAVTMVMFLAIGGDTEDAMKEDVWRQAGLCDKYCHWIDETPECKRQQARFLPCEVNRAGALFWDDYLNSLSAKPSREQVQ
jgi:hypothetical protein